MFDGGHLRMADPEVGLNKKRPPNHQTFRKFTYHFDLHLNGLVQDCSNSIANALELLQSCT